ncbi:[PSI+] inducibility protein 3 [Candida viswanathii]|uniref:[PSI+] inducibility protein 3 n=1 Tax=Candida viswanathii TaxID=5486 RepID=A0A367XVW6_9ASCO|nr:[PSI+] inducibility protein 3 [Candida viswanathii]
MSAALVNRSLTTIRTELEFLKDSDVITEGLYDKLLESLPVKYQKDSAPWDVDKLASGANGALVPKIQSKSSADVLADDLASTSLSVPPPAYPPAQPPREAVPRPVGYCIATYDYSAQQDGDLDLRKDDKLAIVEHLSEDWWKGYKSTSGPEKTGVFPSNYVKLISQLEFENNDRKAEADPAPSPTPYQQQAGYGAYGTPAPYQQAQPPLLQHSSYGGYAQYPPPSTNYYPPQQYQPPAPQQQQQQVVQQEQQPQQQSQSHEHLKKFGSKFGNAAIFGAGATVGSNIVNSIF